MDRPVNIRDVEACIVVTMTRRISIDELDDFLDEGFQTLEEAAGGHADPVLHPFVIYHDGLTVDQDGTVEICQPILCALDPTTLPEGVTTRAVEPQREAWVPVTKAELNYPDIDDIYDDLDAWVEDAGLRRNGPPREVYWADWDDTGMEEPVCDVCFPVDEG